MIKTKEGDTVGIFKILREMPRNNSGHKMFEVQCLKCGKIQTMRHHDIAKVKECKHLSLGGYYSHPNDFRWTNKRIKHIFSGMKKRCYDRKNKNYKFYGAKGIKIYDGWLSNPQSFERWSLEIGYEENLTIDRIDSSKDYSPDNCRWVTFIDNSRYKSTTRMIEVAGYSLTGRQWADKLNIGPNTINRYMRDYGEDITKKLIKAILKYPDEPKRSNQSLLEVYKKYF